MSENTRQTLFGFRTTRAPELLSDAAKAKYFAQHYDLRQVPAIPGTGPFFTAVATKPSNQTVREAMEQAAAAFSPVLSKEEAITTGSPTPLDHPLYDFALEVIPMRNDITLSDFNDAATGVATLGMAEELMLWDNLFYQLITQESPYTREAIIYMLLANHILLVNASNAPTEDYDAQLLCKSRIVAPEGLFKIENDYRTASTDSNIGADGLLLQGHVGAMQYELLGLWAKRAAKEVSLLKKKYEVDLKVSEKLTQDTHKNQINLDIQAGASDPNAAAGVDPFTNQEITLLPPDFEQTEYVFTQSTEIDVDAFVVAVNEGDLSDEAFYVMTENKLLTQSTYDEVLEDIDRYVTEQETNLFENTEFGIESIEVNGTAIPTCNIETRYNQKYSYMVRAVNKTADNYALILSVDIGSECTQLRDMTVTVDPPTGASKVFDRFKASNRNGIVTIHVTQGKSCILEAGTASVGISGILKFDNGLELSFSDTLPIDAYGTTGYMVPADSQSGNEELFVPSGYGLSQLGINEYRQVEQYLCRYEPGEVSHIENVMAREYKEKSTRRLRRNEDSTTSTSEVETENLTDTTTTSRFDMQSQASEVLAQSRDENVHADAYGSTSGKVPGLGDVTAGFSAGANLAMSSSKEESKNLATNFAKDITQKTLQRVVSKISEQRTIKIVEEFEENNRHGFDNRKGDAHVSGVYRWIDKIYKNEVRNYGMRLQYEFMIPEPAAFHLIAKKRNSTSDGSLILKKPLDPRSSNFGTLAPLKSAGSISESNYMLWAAAYNAEVSPPPSKTVVVGKTFHKQEVDDESWSRPQTFTENLPIPEGYGFKQAIISGDSFNKTKQSRVLVSVGDNTRAFRDDPLSKRIFDIGGNYANLGNYVDSIPVGAEFFKLEGGIININIELARKEAHYHSWQLETFRAIIDAYNLRAQEYSDKLAELEAKRSELIGDNPGYYRQIEQLMLKKNCIAYLMGHTNMGKGFAKGSKMANFHVDITEDMDKYAATVKFFEQAFEWEIMSYKFYPFYWAGKNKWTTLYDIENDDPIFKSFLQAGMGRVVASVRPGFEYAVMHYMATGQIWDGGEVPIIGENLYLSIAEELKEPEYEVGDTWETRVPSTLTLIQASTLGLQVEDENGNPVALPNYCPTAGITESFSAGTDLLGNLESAG